MRKTKFKYKTENERLDQGLCPRCESDLVKTDEYDDTAMCPKCKWLDPY